MAHIVRRVCGLAAGLCAAVVISPAAAIGDPESASSDFLFARPRVTFGVRGHWIFASSDGSSSGSNDSDDRTAVPATGPALERADRRPVRLR